MLLTIGIILLVAWLLGLVVFSAPALIHLLLVLAVISVIIHLISGRPRAV
ncbi:MAG TPA: lmo0937 family membrane protein [Thermoanaerobaculia bacterium]|jgi:hypothetical protein|nr:lmo0937 family membrane protein [Thermoanaerobaculia bacterium]